MSTNQYLRPKNAKLVCNAFKWGEYNPLRCCLETGHAGEHAYVVVATPDTWLLARGEINAPQD